MSTHVGPSPTPSPASRVPVADQHFVFDLVLCGIVTLLTLGPSMLGGYGTGSIALQLLITLPLMVRRLLPSVAFVVMLFGAVGVVATSSQIPAAGLVAVPILIYTFARWNAGPLSRGAFAAGMVGSLIGPLRWTLLNGSGVSGLSLFAVSVLACAGVVVASYAIGRRRRDTEVNAVQREQSLAERNRLLVAEQQQRDRAATVDERTRIARDLHDIVAHSLSVIVVQAEGGKALAAKRPEKAPEVLGTIAETSREALAEMRRMVGLLRSGQEGEGADYVPAPGLDAIGELVRKTSDTAELSEFGTPPPVSSALGLTAYRIVQESLTNVLKHAGPAARTRVTLAYTPVAVEIEVRDDGRGAEAVPDGQGHGLQGMAERVALHGGSLSAAPAAGGGFVVRASLPLDDPTNGGFEPTVRLGR